MCERFRKVLLDFQPIFLTFILILAVSAVICVASFESPSLNYVLAASLKTPWGIVTSLFVHGGGIEHLTSNMLALFSSFLLFALSNSSFSDTEKKRRILFLLIAVFSTAIVSNLFCIILVPRISSTGSSGMVFASQGVLMAFSLSNSFEISRLGTCNKKDRKSLLTICLMNLLVFSSFFLQILLIPRIFLNVAPNVNVFVHSVAFLCSFCLASLYQVEKRHDIGKHLS